MNLRLIAGAFVVAIPLLWYAPQASAEGRPLAPGIGVHMGVEYYTWEEFDGSGSRLLSESGPRGTLSLSIGNANRRTPGFVYRIDGRGYYGDISYDGKTQPAPSVKVQSDTRYIGGQAEFTGGYRFVDVLPATSLDVLASGGLSKWQRKIFDTQTAGGTPVSGSTENYRVFYVKAGVGLFHVLGRWSHYLQLGVKEPVDIREDAHFSGSSVVVNPRRHISFYLSWEIDRLNARQQRTFGVTIYYDSLRLDQSPSVRVGSDVVYQPESHQNMLGVQVGYYFNPF